MPPHHSSQHVLTAIFIAAGYDKIKGGIAGFDATVPFVQGKIAATGLYNPSFDVAKLMYAIATSLEFFGGLLLLIGAEKLGATLLLCFLAAVRCWLLTLSSLCGCPISSNMQTLRPLLHLFFADHPHHAQPP